MGAFYLDIHTNLFTNEVKLLLITFNYIKNPESSCSYNGMRYTLHVVVKIKNDNGREITF